MAVMSDTATLTAQGGCLGWHQAERPPGETPLPLPRASVLRSAATRRCDRRSPLSASRISPATYCSRVRTGR